MQEAVLHAEEALAGHLGVMLESGEAVPPPSTLDALPRPIEPDVVEAARLLVPVSLRAAIPVGWGP